MSKAVREMNPGDVVLTHGGMRVLVTRPPRHSASHSDRHGGVFYTEGRVLNRESVSRETVPHAFTLRPDGKHRWNLQGNDLRQFQIEGAGHMGLPDGYGTTAQEGRRV